MSLLGILSHPKCLVRFPLELANQPRTEPSMFPLYPLFIISVSGGSNLLPTPLALVSNEWKKISEMPSRQVWSTKECYRLFFPPLKFSHIGNLKPKALFTTCQTQKYKD